MKKTYIKPEVNLYKVNTCTILAGSFKEEDGGQTLKWGEINAPVDDDNY